MDVFNLRAGLIEDYQNYVESFIHVADERIRGKVEGELDGGLLWPEPLVQLNASFESGGFVDDLVAEGLLHPECPKIFRVGKDSAAANAAASAGKPLRLHRHQTEAIQAATTGANYVLTTGTGSGKSLAYIIPIVDHVLRRGSGRGVQAIVIYPMNALANSQAGELEKFLSHGYPQGKPPVTFQRYTGQEGEEKRQEIIQSPPDILLTNYVMLELMLTRPAEKQLLVAAEGIRFLVLDELHTYRGRQGADVGFLVRRVRNRLAPGGLQVVGTSATLAGPGSYHEQRAEVARVATQLFGAEVLAENVIGETLRRATKPANTGDPAFRHELTEWLDDIERPLPTTYHAFVAHPLARWVEGVFGVEEDAAGGRLVRAQPRSIGGPDGAAMLLAGETGVPEKACELALQRLLMAACACDKDPETGFPPFAFRLHQFISRGDTVYASAEGEDTRSITLHGQKYVPGNRGQLLLPLAFCRECGQEYYVVTLGTGEHGRRVVEARDVSRRGADEDGDAGYLYVSTARAWDEDPETLLDRLPEDWIDVRDGKRAIKKDQRKNLPRAIRVGAGGVEDEAGIDAHFIPAPFRFCLRCGVSYGSRIISDFTKLGQLGSEGRSTATTVLGMSAVRGLKADADLTDEARKLLSFSDNRQDASLQAGHFNDFVEVGLLRAALYRAAETAGNEGLRHESLTQAVFAALDLDVADYTADPDVKFQAANETRKALRDVLGYRLYIDQRRGWRITLPNLEQCGLLQTDYLSLEELCAAEEEWEGCHQLLVEAPPETRVTVARTLLDWMRRALAIKVDYLDGEFQERIRAQSNQRLRAPWDIDDNEKMETATVVLPRSERRGDYGGHAYLSGRSGFGLYLNRQSTFPGHQQPLKTDERETIIRQLLEVLRVAGLVEVVLPAKEGDVPGYQVPAAAMVWKAGDGTKAFRDPLRMPQLPEEGGRTNDFFLAFYRRMAAGLKGFEAREHTAQVPYRLREEREERFRKGHLPILFCSPTMELGVDIAELNVVNMRNIPPTPANYAQRSGRAGRSGRPALVYSYCSTGSPHDQYFFRRPKEMVAGAVAPPRIDLANEDLVRAHVHAVWLKETGMSLGRSLQDLLELEGDEPTLKLRAQVETDIHNEQARERARARAAAMLAECAEELAAAGWYSDKWLDEVLDQVALRFDSACDRWRDLYRAAHAQAKAQGKIVLDATRSKQEKDQAKLLRREAEQQLALLTDVDNLLQSDFYSYRYFASEGFLPGYSFPRLPLSAFIPGSRKKKGDDEFLQRPRFLAISEFGPRAIVYHEGSRYIINKAILPVREEGDLTPTRAKICAACGYLHVVRHGDGPDLCESCGKPLSAPRSNLFRLQNVATKRRDRISSDEEERQRLGYQLITSVRFDGEGNQAGRQVATVEAADGTAIARLTYGHTATIWRVNLGWSRRKNKEQEGFVLDTERGYWAKNQEDPVDDVADQDPMSAKTARVIPFVEDRRNCLLLELADPLSPELSASLQAALKRAIQVVYQLEDNELAVESLPDDRTPRHILLYEAAEGGAGALRQLLEEGALGQVAAVALELCHFDPVTGRDRGPEKNPEPCEAACYDCLMSYQNQRYHPLLDRQLVRDVLLKMTVARVVTSPGAKPRAEHLADLMKLADSKLEKDWLQFLEERNLHLPSHAQVLIEECSTRPDFLYKGEQVAVYIDGPPHDYPERQQRDAEVTAVMEDYGYTVIRFRHTDDWSMIISKYPYIFGSQA